MIQINLIDLIDWFDIAECDVDKWTQVGHQPGKPGKVGEFDSGQGKVRKVEKVRKICFAFGVLLWLWSQNKHSLSSVKCRWHERDGLAKKYKETYLANPHHSDHVFCKSFVYRHRYVVNVWNSRGIWWGLESGDAMNCVVLMIVFHCRAMVQTAARRRQRHRK